MRRRSLLRGGAVGSLVATAGCLSTGWRLAAGDIVQGGGQARLHDASRRFVRGGVGPNDPDGYRAWLFTETPSRSPFTDEADSLAEAVATFEYGRGFLLLVEANRSVYRRVRLGPHPSVAPEWLATARARLPVLATTAVDDANPLFGGAAEGVVTTALVAFASRLAPHSAAVSVWGPEERLLAEIDARPWDRPPSPSPPF